MSFTYDIDVPQAADYPRLLAVWEASVRATHHFLAEDKIRLFKIMIVEQQLFEKSSLFCIRKVTGEIAGFAGVSGENLDMLFLDPSVIGTGAGKALMRYATDVLGATRVDVNEQNEHARRFYERFGFRVISRSETDDNGEPFPLLRMHRIPASVRLLEKGEPVPYELLMLADEEMQAINRYIRQSDIYVAETRNEVVGVCALYPLDEHTMEIKAIAVAEAYQNQGIGKHMLHCAETAAKEKGHRELIIGTPTTARKQLAIYQKAGFEQFDVKENFFILYYTQPIFEDGVQLKDMAMLRKQLK